MPKTNIYIDGFNLYYGKLKRTPYKWLDVAKLCQAMLPQDTIQSIKFFTAHVSARPHDRHLPVRQQIYFRALKTIPNLTIVYGHFLTHSVSMILTDSNPIKRVWVDKTEEKGSDVNLTSHLLHDGFKGLFDTAVIISNDSDLAEPVKIVRQALNLQVGILNPHETHSKTLQQYASFVKRIRQSHLIASQFPNPMTDQKGVFHKPQGW
ncbi:MAG: NYN domain-containing protein [Nitrospirales bacterium]